jgi:hypothetical protein
MAVYLFSRLASPFRFVVADLRPALAPLFGGAISAAPGRLDDKYISLFHLDLIRVRQIDAFSGRRVSGGLYPIAP